LIAPSPGMVFLRLLGLLHNNRGCARRWGLRCFSYGREYFCELHPLPSVVHLHCCVLPLAHQRLAFRRTIAAFSRLQLQAATFVADHPVVANCAFCLQSKNLTQFSGRWSPPVIVLGLGRSAAQNGDCVSANIRFPEIGLRLRSWRSLSAAFS